jgi:hypothetical protein
VDILGRHGHLAVEPPLHDPDAGPDDDPDRRLDLGLALRDGRVAG